MTFHIHYLLFHFTNTIKYLRQICMGIFTMLALRTVNPHTDLPLVFYLLHRHKPWRGYTLKPFFLSIRNLHDYNPYTSCVFYTYVCSFFDIDAKHTSQYYILIYVFNLIYCYIYVVDVGAYVVPGIATLIKIVIFRNFTSPIYYSK